MGNYELPPEHNKPGPETKGIPAYQQKAVGEVAVGQPSAPCRRVYNSHEVGQGLQTHLRAQERQHHQLQVVLPGAEQNSVPVRHIKGTEGRADSKEQVRSGLVLRHELGSR